MASLFMKRMLPPRSGVIIAALAVAIAGCKPGAGAQPSTPAAVPAPAESRKASAAQQDRKSPHETVSRYVQGSRVTIVYGRPYTAHPVTGERRTVWGGLVPYNKIWRLGADEATLFVTQQDLELGGVTVPAGAYSLFMYPQSDGAAMLIINREIGQWGIDPYHPERELARVPLTRTELPSPVDQFTIEIGNGNEGGGVLRFSWERAQYAVPFRVKAKA